MAQAMVPPKGQHQQQISDGRTREEECLRHPKGQISEEIISPVSLLRSDRFVRRGLIASPPSRGQFEENIRHSSASITDAETRIRTRRDLQILQSDANYTVLQSRPGTAPQKVRAKAKCSGVMRPSRTYQPVTRDQTGHLSHKRGDPKDVDISSSKQSSDDFGELMNHSPSDNPRTWKWDTQENYNGSSQTTDLSTPNSTPDQEPSSPTRPPLLLTNPRRELLSPSPIRSSSAPSSGGQFQSSPLKSRPMTAINRRSSQMETELSNFDKQLHEHIQAFQAQQELYPVESRISISPLMDRQGTASDWAQRQKLPDPCMVRPPQRSADLKNLTLISMESLIQVAERLTSTTHENSGNFLTSCSSQSCIPGSESGLGESSRSVTPPVLRRSVSQI